MEKLGHGWGDAGDGMRSGDVPHLGTWRERGPLLLRPAAPFGGERLSGMTACRS